MNVNCFIALSPETSYGCLTHYFYTFAAYLIVLSTIAILHTVKQSGTSRKTTTNGVVGEGVTQHPILANKMGFFKYFIFRENTCVNCRAMSPHQ